MQSTKQKMRTAIVVLSILLGMSVMALAGIAIYRYVTEDEHATVVVPDNLIDPGPDEDVPRDAPGSTGSLSGGSTNETERSGGNGASAVEASSLTLSSRKAEDNTPFEATNLFPGDVETKYYCVKAYHKGNITVRYRADVRAGYEKLAEVLKVRVRLLDSGETLYDGLMRDMPESLNRSLTASERTESELYYEITTYLDTDVGNEYMDLSLIADFRWWVEEEGALVPPTPQTGDESLLVFWACLGGASLTALLLILLMKRKKEEDHEGQ